MKICRSSFLFLVVITLISLLGFENANAQTLTARPNVSMAPNTYGYYEYLPLGYNPQSTQKYPLLIAFGGLSQNGDGSLAQLDYVFSNWGGPGWQIQNGKFPSSFTVNGKLYRFIVILPQFKSGASPANVDQVITYLLANYQADPNRIYITGNSSGGGYCWDYPGASLQYGQRIAATIPTCAAAGYSVSKAQNIAAANLPVWATHNAVDAIVSPGTTMSFVNGINSVPAPPTPRARMSIFQDVGHNCADSTFNTVYGVHTLNGLNIYEWLLTNTRATITLAVTGMKVSAHKKDNNKAEIDWSTYSEENNKGFVIQRSRDGVDFDSIGFRQSTAPEGRGASYSFIDLNAFNGENYYRLMQIDNNNRTGFSAVASVKLQKNNSLRIYPNPVRNNLSIYIGEDINNAQLRIVNANGQVVKRSSVSGSGHVDIDVNGLSKGVYSVEINDGADISKNSFVKY
ncbi:MAG: T9SS type A sorting domain-containing protein [Bacteroidota bacterium]|nr:T9SS type A sorting domain-containing protein [Bacteroidota bacterium]